MAIEVTDLTTLDTATVQNRLATLRTQLLEANPTLSLRRGVLHDLLLYYEAVLATKTETEWQRYLSARSLLDIAADPTLADADIVNAALSNWGVTRQQGTAATGVVTIVLSAANNVTIGAGQPFTAAGQTFTADSSFTAKTESALINGVTDRLLSRLSDGNWAFTITVTAADAGAAGTVVKNTLVVPSSLPTGYVTSYATDDFTGGTDTETNAELLNRLQQGAALKAPGNRVGMAAMLRQQPAFARVPCQSVIGCGDAEMLRDQHTVWPGGLGGVVDWYVRTQDRVELTTVSKTATLLSVGAGGGTWQVELARDEVPGFYEVASIVLPTGSNETGTFAITSDTRGYDLTEDTALGFIPDIASATEAAYTRYQTAVVRFVDTVTDHSALSAGATANYYVTVRRLPLVAELQDFVSGYDYRSAAADTLVKAAIPCFTRIEFVIAKKRTQADPDLNAIRAAVASVVNSTDFTGRLYVGRIQDAIHGLLSDGMSVGAVDMFGRIRQPDGTLTYLRSESVLEVQDLDGTMVSPRTVQFFCSPDTDVAVSTATDVPVPA